MFMEEAISFLVIPRVFWSISNSISMYVGSLAFVLTVHNLPWTVYMTGKE